MSKTLLPNLSRRRLALVGVIALGLYVIVPQLGGFRDSWQYLRQPDITHVLVAIGFTLFTYACAATTYYLLAFRHISYWRTLLVQFAAMFVNRLLPAGIGAAGVGYTYLLQQRHKSPQAATVIAVNNTLGFTGHILIVVAALLVSNVEIQASQLKLWLALPVGLGVGALVIFLLYTFGGRRIKKFIRQLRHDLVSYRHRLPRLATAQLSSIGLTLTNILALYFCTLAVGVELPVVAIVIIFTFGVALGTATPTPGGLGGFEAGLVAGFTAYDIDPNKALAAALLYRLISYWLTLLLGGLAFLVVIRRKLLKL